MNRYEKAVEARVDSFLLRLRNRRMTARKAAFWGAFALFGAFMLGNASAACISPPPDCPAAAENRPG